MRPRLVLFALLFALLVSSTALAQSAAQPADVVVLNDGQDKYPLGHHLEILRDPSEELTIQDVTSAAYQDQFIPSQVDTPNFSFQNAVYWVRFRVRSLSEQPSNWVLELGFANMHYMDLYLPSPDGGGYQVIQSGALRPYKSRDYPFHLLAFNLELPPGSEQTIYIRFQNQASMTLPLVLWSPSAFNQHALIDNLILGAFFGILFLMALYNTFLYLLVRDQTYLYLDLVIIGLGVYYLFYDAVIYQFITIQSTRWATTVIPIVIGIELLVVVKFVDSLLDLKEISPKSHLFANYLAGIWILISIGAFFGEYRSIITIEDLLALITILSIFILGLVSWRAGNRQAQFLFASWFWILIGGIVTIGVRLNVLPSSTFTEELVRFGIVWMLAVWSLALADRVNTLKAETENANRQLSESESRLSQFLEAMPVGVLVYDTDLKPHYINQETRRLLGNPAIEISPDLRMQKSLNEELTHFSFRIAGTEQPYPLEQLPIVRAIDGKPASADNIEIVLGDRHIPLEVWASPLFNPEGEVSGALIAFQNISDRLQKEALLQESQELQRLALEGARLGIWSNDLVSGDVVWDSRIREIFGVLPDEPATLDLGFSLIHPEDRERAQKAFEQATAPHSDGTYAEEKRIVRPDGQIRWISTRGKAVFEGRGAERRAIRLVGTVMDVTERMEAQRALEESEARYRRLVEIMNEGLGVADENDRFIYVNPRLADMLGYSIEEMIGHPVVEFFDEENQGLLADQFARRRLGEQQPYTLTWRRKDGSELHTQIAPAAVFSESGEYQRSIAVVTDISEQVKAGQFLEQRVVERTHELSTLLEVSQVVAGTLELEPLLKVILEELQSVIDFDGAAIISLEDRTLTTLNSPLKIKTGTAARLIPSISTSLNASERFQRDEAIIIADVQADTPEGHDFRATASILFDIYSAEMRAWMGIPLKVKEKLIGVLSVHHHQADYYTPAMAQLAHAFANQAAVAIENSRLYRQAQAAAASGERRRLARELHDSVTQALYSLTLYAEATRLALHTGKAEAAEKNLSEVLAIAREGMGDLRLLIFELRPPVLEEEGLVGALQARLEAVEARAGCQAEFHVQGEPNLSREVETELYWAVHEALNNVLKHARAQQVNVDLQFHNGTSKITIQDDGVGFDSSNIERISGIGIKNITERINRIGGSFKIESKRGQGTFFEVKLAARE